jgi:hypothetical protein
VKLESATGGTVNAAASAADRPYVLEFLGCAYPMLLDPALAVAGAFGVTAVPTGHLVVNGR